MTSFTDPFGGSTVQAAQVAYRAVNLTASITTLWPPYATANNYLARVMDVNCTVGALTLALPDATLTGVGQDVFVNNVGNTAFTVTDFAGNSIAVVNPGAQRYIYLASNATQAGTWRSMLFGVGSSSPDASQLAGYGIAALNNTLNQSAPVNSVSGATSVVAADRSKVFVWTGAAGALNLPALPIVPDGFFIEFRNQGTGAVTVTPAGVQTIDGASSSVFNVGDSGFIHGSGSSWFTVGRGRSAQFNFTQLLKTVTGGTTALSLTEAANVVQTYNGTLTSNQIVVLPGVVQVYYISNQTTGAFSLTFKSPVTGTTLTIPQGQNAVVFCDSTNVINASTTVSGITSVVFGAGTAASPSIAISTNTTGLYSSGANEVGVTCNASQVAAFNTSGLVINSTAALAYVSVVSAANNAAHIADRVAGKQGSYRFRTAGVDRWALVADTDAESGANAGSTLNLAAYSDVGALLGNYLSIARATGASTFSGNVGIGGVAPLANLHVLGAVGAAPSNSSVPLATLQSSTAAGVGVGPALLFKGNTGNATAVYSFAAIQGFKASAVAGNYLGSLAFYLQDAGGSAALTEWMRLTAGFLGVGTGAPNGVVTAYSTTAFNAQTSGFNAHRPSAYGNFASMAFDATIAYFSSTYTGGGPGSYGQFVFQAYDSTAVPIVRAQIDANGVTSLGGNASGYALRVAAVAGQVNYAQLDASVTGSPVVLSAQGTDANVALLIVSKGTGVIGLYTNGGATKQVEVSNVALANRYITLAGSNGGNPTLGVSAGSLAVSAAVVGAAALGAYTAQATTAGGFATPAFTMGTAGVGLYWGSGAPSISGTQGSLYLRTDGAGVLYANTNGSTGWVSISGVGVGQTWQDVTASRASGTVYTNSSGATIEVHVQCNTGGGTSYNINGNSFSISAVNMLLSFSFLVPNGNTYTVTSSISKWLELR